MSSSRSFTRVQRKLSWCRRRVERLNDQAAVDLRNSAAHDQALTREDARAARAWALGILQYL